MAGHEHGLLPLDGIGPRLAQGLTRSEVPLEHVVGEGNHFDEGSGDIVRVALPVHETDPRVHSMAATRETPQHPACIIDVARLTERLAIYVDHGVGTDHERSHVIAAMPLRNCVGLGAGQPQCEIARRFTLLGRLIDVRRFDFECVPYAEFIEQSCEQLDAAR